MLQGPCAFYNYLSASQVNLKPRCAAYGTVLKNLGQCREPIFRGDDNELYGIRHLELLCSFHAAGSPCDRRSAVDDPYEAQMLLPDHQGRLFISDVPLFVCNNPDPGQRDRA